MPGASRTGRGIRRRDFVAAVGAALAGGARAGGKEGAVEGLRAGAAAVDITPVKFPVIVNGGFLERKANKAHWPLHARCLVLDDGRSRIAIVVVDSCVIPQYLLDEAKDLAHRATEIPIDRMLISATHTHSAPSVVGALGTGRDEAYARFLPGRIAEAIRLASSNVEPAKIGWKVTRDFEHTHCRRWIRRPDKIGTDPFGRRTVRAMMHPGYQNPDYLGPAGPVDPDLSLLSLQSLTGKPIAVLANYSMHYFGAPAVSSDYYGLFADKLTRLIGAENADPPFVAMMSQGTSGDLHWMDYGRPKKSLDIQAYTEAVAEVAREAYKQIEYRKHASIVMRERKIILPRRVPDEERLAWAKKILAKMKNPTPRNKTEVYAREQVLLAKRPTADVKLQALRIGEVGIAAIPCEVFGVTGLKIKAQSPLRPTVNIELANGYAGYIPPPEQHELGGYTTWEARSAGLEVEAEPKIVDAVLALLEEVSGKRRRSFRETHGSYAKAVLASEPLAYWRMGEFEASTAVDATGKDNHGLYEDGVALYLEGPDAPSFCGKGRSNRAPRFAGGRMKSVVIGLPARYTVEMWFCNDLPYDVRPVTGYLFSRGADGAKGAPGDHVGLGGTHSAAGRLIFYNGDSAGDVLCGETALRLGTWYHLAMVRQGETVAVYLNGDPNPEVQGKAAVGYPPGIEQVFVGGRNDGFAGFEGRIDEVAIYGRALAATEIAKHYALAEPRPLPKQKTS